MFEQFIGDGANIFINIVAVLIGLKVAVLTLDFQKTKKEEAEKEA